MDKQKQIINFLKYLSLHGVSPKSLKYYKSDFISFLNWAGNKKINQSLILEYINSIRAVTPISTLKRRQSTLRSYASFMGFKKVSNTWQESILYAFTKKPRLQNFFHKLFFSRPNWYRTYHSYQLATYIHVAILVLFTSIAGFAVYDQIFNTKNNLLAFPTALTRPNRYLSFQGRLTSNVGNPITTATNLVFKLYDASTAGTELWTSGTCSITPDQDGIFSTLLGTTTNCPTATEIAATVFSENASVWVGVTVAADAEATPRVQIATVAYALNSETLQGYPAGTGTSTIPYIDSSGTVVLASASPKIQSTSGTFAVEGLAMTITTPNASNGVITVNPDGVGTLNLTFEGAAAGLSANGFVNATNANITSGALYGGTVASAATGYNFIDFQSGVSPTSKFSVQDDGDIITAGDLTLSGGNLNTGNIALTIGDATTDTITLTTDGTGNGEVVLPNDSIGPNEILSTGQTDEYCLTYEGTGTTWEWQSCAAAGGGSWSALTVPTANLSLAHAGYTTAFTFDSVTTADAFALSSSSLTTGTVLDLSSTSTAGGASGLSKVLDIARSGTNTNASHTAYGLYSAVTNTGTTSTNVGGYFSASGATNNYGLLVANGNVGIGTTTPNAKLKVIDSSTRAPSLAYDAVSSWELGSASISLVGSVDTGAPWAVWLQARDNTAGSTAYPISLNPLGGNVGIGTTAPTTALQVGTASETHTLSTGDALISSDLEVDGVLYLDGGTISNSAGTASLVLSATPTTTANSLSAGNWLIENTANVGQAALIVNNTKSSDLFTASASGVTKFTIANTGAITSAIGDWTSQVADSSTAVGFTFNTSNTLSTQGSKLLSFQNLGTEKMYLDKDGNLYVAGTLLSGNGTSMLLTNKSGGVVANRALVILDSSNNSSFTTTTTPYNKAGFGVVVGVGLGVTNDADGDGACDANDICMVAYGGEVEVTVKNASTAVKGDYLFTSDTAGSAVASAKQYDGLVGVISNIAGAGSGYVKMIFKVQPQVTAAAAIDKTTKHNEYWLYADQYQAVGEGANTDTNLLVRGLTFDNFTDTTKVDSTNTTASLDTNTQRTGLIGGQTMATSTTDNDGQTYLGSNTVNDQYYYDRTRDSSPQVQVELGIDPNWYNGVTLSVATSSASFSQNSVIASGAKQSNPNLSTSYNGSLVKVTGTDSTPRTIYITIKSPTTFDWTNYNGQAATGVTITSGTAQTLGTTGVSVTFTNARYNTGDVFKIASWFIEAESATRGAKQQFPERSNVIATASSVDIIDADTQKLWMRFSQGTNYAIGVDANNDPSSANMLNGKAYISTNGSAATGLYTLDFAHDAVFKQNATDYRLSDTALTGRNAANTYNVINTSNILVNITVNDVSAAVIPNQPTQNVTVSGWGYIQGSGSATYGNETVNYPYKFNQIPNTVINFAGVASSAPTNLNSCVNGANITAYAVEQTGQPLSSFTASFTTTDATNMSASSYYCYTWTATGQVSPRQFVAVGTGATNTDGGTTIINETDGTKADILSGAVYGIGPNQWETKVALTSNNSLYSVWNNDSGSDDSLLAVYRNVHGLSTETVINQYENDYYRVGTSTSIPSILAPATGSDLVTSLAVTEGTSTAQPKANTVYVGTTSGLSVIQESDNHGNALDGWDENVGSVKYYTKDYISEEMVGDIRGMWPLSANGAISMSDASVKADTLTNNGTATAVTGIRGTGVSFDGSTQYLSCTDAACGGTSKLDYPGSGSWSFGAWVNLSSTSGARDIISKAAGGQLGWELMANGGIVTALATNSSGGWDASRASSITLVAGQWYYITAVYTPSSILDIYVNGQLANGTLTGSIPSTIRDTTAAFEIGSVAGGAQKFAGTIDEPFVTATALTAGQIKHMYEVGYRALQSHATTLGGGAADTNQQLGGTTNTIGAVQPDLNNQFMYVGTNSTTLGAVSKIQLNSDTNIKTYNSSANVPAGGALLVDEDTKSLAVGYNLEAVGSAASGVKTMGVDNNATATSGNFIGKTITTAESFTQAYLWAQYVTDSSDSSNSVTVWASNDNGASYSQCNLTNTDTSRSPPEYEYFCQFNTAGSSLKTKFVMARGSTKTNTWVSKYGIAWIDSNAVAGSANGSGLFTNTNASVANGSYIDVAHNQNSNDLVTNGWINLNGVWKDISTATESGVISATNASLADGSYVEVTHNQNTNAVQADGWYYDVGNSKWIQINDTPEVATDSGTIAYWHMDEDSGSSVGDSSNNGKTGTATGTTVVGGKTGKARSFNGSSDYVNMGDIFNNSSPLSFEVWFKTNTIAPTYQEILAKSGNASDFDLQLVGSTLTFYISTGGSNKNVSYLTAIVPDQWYHVAVTWDGSNAKIYVNGSYNNQVAATGARNTNSNNLYIGLNSASLDRYFNGTIDEVRLSNSARTAEEIARDYQLGLNKFLITQPDNNNVRLYNNSGATQNVSLAVSSQAFQVQQVDANTVRLYNYSGSTQNLRLDVITGGLGRNAGTVSLAPAAADVDSAASTNSIWINKTGSGGNLLKLQTSGTDVLSLTGAGLMTLTGNFAPGTDDTYDLGTNTARWKDIYLGPATAHIGTSTTDEGTISYDTSGNIFNFGTDATTNADIAFFTDDLYLDKSTGNVGIGTTTPTNILSLGNAAAQKFWIENTASGTVGRALTVAAGGTVAGGTDIVGGNLILQSGLGTGTGASTISFQTGTTLTTGTTLQTMSTKMTILGNGNVGIGTTGPNFTLDVAGAIRNRTAADASPYTQARLIVYGGTNVDASQWAYFAYGNDAQLRQVYSKTGSTQPMHWGTTSAMDNTGAFTQTMSLTESGNLTNIGTLTVQGTGNSSIAGNVGIGTTGPGAKLDIQENNSSVGNATGIRLYQAGAGDSTVSFRTTATEWGIGLDNSDADKFKISNFTGTGDYGSTGLTIDTAGNVGIGTTGPGYLLTVNSSTPGCNGCTAWTNYSDSRLKENIVNLSGDILDKIMDLKPVTFNYNDAYYSQTGYTRPDGTTPTFTGFVAQDLQQIFPEMVSTASSGYLDTNLSNLQIYLVKGIQQQQGQIASLSGQLASLLQIDGSCVTGDTMLPIRRKKKRRNSDDEQDEYDDLLCRIDDILPDDEVLSLNETTGSLDYSKINKLMDMGIKEVYELVTKSGKVIRTTANHPYLTLTEDGPIISKGKINI